jgi:acyl-CoA thioester hydrolase
MILEHHLDFFGHVNHATYFELFEEARWDMITRQGYGVNEMKDSNIGPVILEALIRYRRELVLRQKIIIKTQILSLKGSIFKLHQNMSNEAEEICCEANFTCGFFDLVKRKLAPVPKAWIYDSSAK